MTDNEQDAPKERDVDDLERLLAEAEAGDLLACADLAGRAASLARQVINLSVRVAELEAFIENDADWKFSAKRRLTLFREQRARAEAAEAELARLRQGEVSKFRAQVTSVMDDAEYLIAIGFNGALARPDECRKWFDKAAVLRAALVSPGDGPSEYEKKVAQMKRDFPNGI